MFIYGEQVGVWISGACCLSVLGGGSLTRAQTWCVGDTLSGVLGFRRASRQVSSYLTFLLELADENYFRNHREWKPPTV